MNTPVDRLNPALIDCLKGLIYALAITLVLLLANASNAAFRYLSI